MAAKWTRADAFAYFGAQGKNPRWSWSARSADGKTVVLTMWQDEFRQLMASLPTELDHEKTLTGVVA